MDYRFLVGEQFVLRGRLYRVCGIAWKNGRRVVRAASMREPTARLRLYPIEAVLPRLVPHEEIRLAEPG